MYHGLQACCFVSWMANFIYSIFGVVFMNLLGVSLSGIFLLNVLIIVVSFFASTILNQRSDRLTKWKKFMILAYITRVIGIFILAIGNDIYLFTISFIIVNLLNPLSFDTAIVYELGDSIAWVKSRVDGSALNLNAGTQYYLKYRRFGSLGWALMAPAAGLGIMMLDAILPSGGLFLANLPGFRILLYLSFLMYSTVNLVFFVIYNEKLLGMVKTRRQECVITEKSAQTADRKKAGQATRTSANALVLLMVAILLFNVSSSLFQTPYAIFMNDFSGGNLFYVGISYFLSAILEIFLFSVAFRIIKSKGYQFLLSLSFLLEIVRVLTTIIVIPLGHPELVLPLQMMNSFCLRWPAITHGVSIVSPRRKATGINLNFILEKVGGLFGSIIGAVLSFNSGAGTGINIFNTLFVLSLIILVITAVTFMAGSIAQGRKKMQIT